MMMKTWKSRPLYTQIKEFLDRKGPMTDMELFDLLKGTHEGVGFGELNKTLMRMEIEGSIYVAARTKGKRRIELTAQSK
jgi:NOL1/NOP2/fmu family ribosome biogenesis protein